MEERRLDLRTQSEERINEARRTAHILHQLNNAEVFTPEHTELQRQLFTGGLGEGSFVHTPLYVNLAGNLHIGNRVTIMPFFKCMSAGDIWIEDGVRIALNVALITNNHDYYDRDVLTIRDIRICKNAWIGANATIMPGVTVGENAIVGAGSIVTKDVAPNTVVVGSPARVVRVLDPEKFKAENE